MLQGDPPPLLRLPPELLRFIVHALEPRPRCYLARCCRSLHRAVSAVQWHSPLATLRAITDREHGSLQDVGRLLFANLLRHARHIRELEFPDPSVIVNGGIGALSTSTGGLVSFDAGGLDPFAIADTDVRELIRRCPMLRRLSLSDCVRCTDSSLLALASSEQIRFFDRLLLDRCSEMTDTGLVALLSKTPHLLHLSLNLIPLATPCVVNTIAITCKKLQNLSMADCDAITDESISWIASGCPDLVALDLSDCKNLTESGLIEFVRLRRKTHKSTYTGFKSMRLNGLNSITDKSLIALLTGECEDILESWNASKVSTGLETLELANVPNVTHIAISAVSSCMPANSLSTLNLNNLLIPIDETSVENMTESLISLFKQQKWIKCLQMAGGLSGAVEMKVCKAIAENLSLLEVLDLSECELVSDDGSRDIAVSCRNLVNVNFKGCMGISDGTVHGFVDQSNPAPSKLQFLNIGLCNKITDAATQYLCRLCSSSDADTKGLHTLKFSGCFDITDATLNSISDSIVTSHNATTTRSGASPSGSLRLLCFSGCHNLTQSAITRLTSLLPHLESINLYSLPNVTNDAITLIAQTCPRIASLVVSKCPVGDVAALAVARGCRRLHTLYMSFLKQVPGKTLAGVSTHLTDVGVRALLENCRGLKLLDLSRSDFISDDGFAGAETLELQVLTVRACPRLTFEGAVRMARRCPRLQALDTLGCCLLGPVEREQLRKIIEG
ncbi:hypothetical protein HDU83_006884 [Entophlyctis luteolus]|nr:hypothetical protein HDU83_006884 [Entophlyctis luteolus]